MSSRPDLKSLLDATAPKTQSLARLNAELEFAYRLSGAHADKTAEWDALLQQAASHVSAGIAIGTDADLLVQQAERLLAPLGEAAKQYHSLFKRSLIPKGKTAQHMTGLDHEEKILRV